MDERPTVSVVDDDPAITDSVRWLLESAGFHVETFTEARVFLDRYDPSQPGCLLLDIKMSGVDGLSLQQQLASREICIPIIFISGHGTVSTAVRAMKQGAFDFIEKPFRDVAVLKCVRAALAQDRECRRKRAEHAEVAARLDHLTRRENEVLEHIISGKPSKLIAATLGLSEKTIEVHRAKLMAKMQADNVADLVRMVLSSRAN